MKEKKKNISISKKLAISKSLSNIERSLTITNKIIKEQNDRCLTLSWDSLFEHKDFFNQFFSTFYPFTEAELIEYCDKLIVGSPSIWLDSDLGYTDTIFGLIFNKNIIWTNNLKTIYYTEPRLLWAGGGTDIYSYEIDFKALPLEINDEVKGIFGVREGQLIGRYSYSDELGDYDDLADELELLEGEFNQLKKNSFSCEQISNIIQSNSLLYLSNCAFCESLQEKINTDIAEFNIERFYSKL